MPLDPEIEAALAELRDELAELRRARTPAARREARHDVLEAREDLEDVLRREGYRLTRRQLDELVDAAEERRFAERVDRYLEERFGADEDAEDGDDDDEADAEGNAKTKKAKSKAKTTLKPDKDEEEEWV